MKKEKILSIVLGLCLLTGVLSTGLLATAETDGVTPENEYGIDDLSRVQGRWIESYDEVARLYVDNETVTEGYGNVSVIEQGRPNNIARAESDDDTALRAFGTTGIWDWGAGTAAGHLGWSVTEPEIGDNVTYVSEIPAENVDADTGYFIASHREVNASLVDGDMYTQYEPIPSLEIEDEGFEWIEASIRSPSFTDADLDDNFNTTGNGTAEHFESYSVFVRSEDDPNREEWSRVGETEKIDEDDYNGEYDDPIVPDPATYNETAPTDNITGMNNINITDLEPGAEYDMKVRVNLGDFDGEVEHSFSEGPDESYTTWSTSAVTTQQTNMHAHFEPEIVSYPEEANETEDVDIDYTIENVGDEAGEEDWQFTITPIDGDEPVFEEKGENLELDVDENVTGDFTWETDYNDAGTYEMNLTTDSDVDTVEFDLAGEDLFEVDVEQWNEPVYESEDLVVTANVTNEGSGPGEQDIHFTVEDGDGQTVFEDVDENVTIDGEDFELIDFVWSTDYSDSGEYTVEVESEDDEAEEDITIEDASFFEVDDVIASNAPEGEEVVVEANVSNLGSAEDIQDVNLTVHAENDGTEFVVDEKEVQLGGLHYDVIELSWDTDYNDAGNYTAVVSSDDDQGDDDFNVSADSFFEVNITESEGVVENEKFVGTYNLTNIGSAEGVQDVTVEMEDDDGTVVESDDYENVIIDGGDSQEFDFEWDTEYGDAGDYTMIVETESQGSAEEGVTIFATEYFAVDIESTNHPVDENEELLVEADIHNLGTMSSEQDITFTVEDEDDNEVFSDETSVSRDGDQSETVEFAWQTEFGDVGHYEVFVASENETDSEWIEVEGSSYFEVEIIDHDEDVVEGDDVEVTVEVTNHGSEEDTQTLDLTVEDGHEDDEPVTVPGDSSTTEELVWNTSEGDHGEHQLNVSSEDDEDSTYVEILMDATFTVNELNVEPDEVYYGEEITIEAEVENIGEAAGKYTAQFYMNRSEEDSFEIGDDETDTVDPDDTATVSVKYETSAGDIGQPEVELEDMSESLRVYEEPRVSTTGHEDVATEEATILGELDVIGLESEITAYFEWGESEGDLDEKTENITLETTGHFNETLEDLEPETEYYYRAVIEWDEKETGDTLSFTTDPEAEFEIEIDEHDEEVMQEEVVEVEYTVTNEGGSEGTQDIVLYVEDEEKDRDENVELGVDETDSGQFTWETSEDDRGEYELTVETEDDHDNVETNVLKHATFEITDLVAEPEEQYVDEDVTIIATVENIGDVAGDYTVEFEGDVDETKELDEELAGGETDDVEITVDHGETGEYEAIAGDEEVSYEIVDTPDVDTLEPEDVDADSATLRGELIDIGLEDGGIDVYFEFADETETDSKTLYEVGEFEDSVDGLEPGTEYDYRAVVEWNGEAETGSWVSFETDDPAEFEVSITDYDDEVEEGDTVTVEYEVDNTGDVDDTQEIVFYVDDDEEATENVELEAGETYEGSFEWEADDEGDYDLEVASDDDSDSVTVTVEEEGIPWTFLVIIGVAVLLAAILLAYFLMKDKYELVVREPEGDGVIKVDGKRVTDYPYTKKFAGDKDVDIGARSTESAFTEWTGETQGIHDKNEKQTTVTMDSDYEISAKFAGSKSRVDTGDIGGTSGSVESADAGTDEAGDDLDETLDEVDELLDEDI